MTSRSRWRRLFGSHHIALGAFVCGLAGPGCSSSDLPTDAAPDVVRDSAPDAEHVPQSEVPQIGETLSEEVVLFSEMDLPPELDELLDFLDLTTARLGVPAIGAPYDTFVLPWTADIKEEPLLLPGLGRGMIEKSRSVSSSPGELSFLVAELGAYATPDGPIRHRYEPVEYTLDSREPLLVALRTLATAENEWPDHPVGEELTEREEELRAQCDMVSLEIQRPLARLLLRLVEAHDLKRRAFAEVETVDALHGSYHGVESLHSASFMGYPLPLTAQYDQGDSFDLVPLLLAAQALLDDLWRAASDLEGHTAEVRIELDTPHGRVILDLDGGDDEHHDESTALIVDLGGHDSYHGHHGATVELWQSASLVLDLDGDDRYNPDVDPSVEPFIEEQSFGQGVGLLGVGLLLDVHGDDEYGGSVLAQGYGAFGVGALIDVEGRDLYRATFRAQGGGEHGVGLLADLDGNDEYTLYSSGQGFGWSRGAGLLLDVLGDDRYTAAAEPALFGYAVYGGRNMSLAQGSGFGRRGDMDGRFMAGGVGVLVDLAGDDRYQGENFVQGTGFWFGVGLLCDDGGHDEYHGFQWVQGSAAHMGLGLILEADGDDTYIADQSTGVALGHDFGIGMIIDQGGDDEVFAPGLGLGSGRDNGFGLFLAEGGEDTYHAPEGGYDFGAASMALDRAGTGRVGLLNIGLFVESGGTDTYDWPGEYEDLVGNDRTWQRPLTDEHNEEDYDISGGIDG